MRRQLFRVLDVKNAGWVTPRALFEMFRLFNPGLSSRDFQKDLQLVLLSSVNNNIKSGGGGGGSGSGSGTESGGSFSAASIATLDDSVHIREPELLAYLKRQVERQSGSSSSSSGATGVVAADVAGGGGGAPRDRFDELVEVLTMAIRRKLALGALFELIDADRDGRLSKEEVFVLLVSVVQSKLVCCVSFFKTCGWVCMCVCLCVYVCVCVM